MRSLFAYLNPPDVHAGALAHPLESLVHHNFCTDTPAVQKYIQLVHTDERIQLQIATRPRKDTYLTCNWDNEFTERRGARFTGSEGLRAS